MVRKITVDDIGFLLLKALTGSEKQKDTATRLLALMYPYSRSSIQAKKLTNP